MLFPVKVSADGMSSFLPVAPAVIICIPAINSPIAMTNPAKTIPNKGDTRTMIPIIINNIPTPIKNALLQPDSCPENPWAIIAPPTKRSAMPMKIDIVQLANPGYAITSPANMRASIPSPIIVHLPLTRRKIPEIILSMPTTNKITASIKTTATNVTAGNASA